MLFLTPLTLIGQFNTPGIDGVIVAGEYGVHVNGQNMLMTSTSCGGNATWYLTWDDDYLYAAVTNCFDASGSGSDALNIYIDIDNHAPVNAGPGSDTGTYFDGNLAILPFRADFFAFSKNGYNAWRSGGSSWSGQDNQLTVANGGSGSAKTIEVKIPWNTITQNSGRPAEFNFLGFISYSCGIYADVPTLNSNTSQCGSFGSSELVRYFTVSSTDSASSTKPFSQESYTHIGNDVSNFGSIDIFDFTMNSPGKTISRFAGNWNIAGILRVHSGTIDFDNVGDNCDVNGHCIIGNNGNLSLSTGIGGDLIVGGDLTVNGILTSNQRSIEFDGNGGINSQSVKSSSSVTFDYLIISNPEDLSLEADIRVNHDLDLQNGSIVLNSNNLTLTNGFSISGSQDSTKMIVTNGTGKLIAEIDQLGIYSFPLGDQTGSHEFSPVDINVKSLAALSNSALSLHVSDIKHPMSPSSLSYIDRYWNIDLLNFDSVRVDISAEYKQADIIGDESTLYGLQYSNNVWTSSFKTNESMNLIEFKNVTEATEFTAGDIIGLPIELKAFQARVNDNNEVIIEWSTLVEINNDHFDVERSSDGNYFEKILTVEGEGNSTSEIHYRVIDKDPFIGTNYYRLRQVDFDGAASLSKTIYADVETRSVDIIKMTTQSLGDLLKIEIVSPYPAYAVLEIFDIQGREISEFPIQLQQGKNLLSLHDLPHTNQIIFIRLSGPFSEITTKQIH